MKTIGWLFIIGALAAHAQTPVIAPSASTGTSVKAPTCPGTGTPVIGLTCGAAAVRAFVQSRSAVGVPTLAFSSNVTSGNLLVLFLGSEGTVDPLTITDTIGTTYTKILARTGNANNVAVYSGRALSSGPNTVSITGLGAPWIKVNVMELSGVTTASVSNSAFFASTANPQNIAVTTTGAALIAAGIMGFHSGNVYTIAAPFAISSQANGTDATGVAWTNQSTAGTYTAAFSENTNSNDNAALAIVAFQ